LDLAGTEPCSEDLKKALESYSYKGTLAVAQEQGQRFVVFAQKQRSALAWLHGKLKGDMRIKYARKRAELRIKHQGALDQLEERQLEREMALQQSQKEEARNVATAVKYMQRYCEGYETKDAHRSITDEDRRRLERQKQNQEKLGRRHESAINVLRGKQELEKKVRLAEQKKELFELDKAMKAEMAALEETSRKLERLIQKRKEQMECQWNLMLEVWRKETELEMGSNTLHGSLPKIPWPLDWKPDAESDSVLDEYQALASPRISPNHSGRSSGVSTPDINAGSPYPLSAAMFVP